MSNAESSRKVLELRVSLRSVAEIYGTIQRWVAGVRWPAICIGLGLCASGHLDLAGVLLFIVFGLLPIAEYLYCKNVVKPAIRQRVITPDDATLYEQLRKQPEFTGLPANITK